MEGVPRRCFTTCSWSRVFAGTNDEWLTRTRGESENRG